MLEKPIHILLLEDSEDDALLIRRWLKKECDCSIECVWSEADMRRVLKNDRCDIILSDFNMPQFDAFRALEVLQELELDIPLIVVSGAIGEQGAVNLLKAGAKDYLMKDNLTRLGPVVLREVEEVINRERTRLTQLELAKRRAQYEEIVETTSDVIFAADTNGQIVFVNRAWCNALGYGPDESLSLSLEDLVTDKYRASCQAHFKQLLMGAPYIECDMEMCSKDKTPVVLSGHVVPRKSNEKVVGVQAVLRNTTRETLAERRAEASEVLLLELVEGLHDGICLLAEEGQILFQNAPANSYLQKMGRLSEDGRLLALHDISFDNFVEMANKPIDIIIDEEHLNIYEVELISFTRATEDGKWVLTIRDVTTERQTRAAAEQKNRLSAVGQLAAGIAHDFNNILSVIMGFAQILGRKDYLNNGDREDLGRIYKQGERAAQLVQQILDFGRQTNVERHRIDLIPVIDDTIKLLLRILPDNIVLSTNCKIQSAPVDVNITQLQQVLTNLIVNARDAMPHGGEIILSLKEICDATKHAYLAKEQESGAWIHLSVHDNGIGMCQDVVERVFEPFFTTKEPGSGTGLGLAQVYGIIKQHKGYIDLKSELDKGSVFHIYLPISTESQPSEIENLKPETIRGNGTTILVVEDEPDVLATIQTMLESINFRVLTAEDGEAAQTTLTAASKEISAVLTDLSMPHKTGLELCEWMKVTCPEIPTLLMSGYPIFNESDHNLASGYICKPIKIDELTAHLERLLGAQIERIR